MASRPPKRQMKFGSLNTLERLEARDTPSVLVGSMIHEAKAKPKPKPKTYTVAINGVGSVVLTQLSQTSAVGIVSGTVTAPKTSAIKADFGNYTGYVVAAYNSA